MKLLVCGGRDFSERAELWTALDKANAKRAIMLLIHGAAPGADSLAAEWAAARGVAVVACPADWQSLGPKAGPIRNQQMLDIHKPDGVLATPGGRGTADMVRRAKAAGVPVWEPWAKGAQ